MDNHTIEKFAGVLIGIIVGFIISGGIYLRYKQHYSNNYKIEVEETVLPPIISDSNTQKVINKYTNEDDRRRLKTK